jgi:hypothetical protein
VEESADAAAFPCAFRKQEVNRTPKARRRSEGEEYGRDKMNYCWIVGGGRGAAAASSYYVVAAAGEPRIAKMLEGEGHPHPEKKQIQTIHYFGILKTHEFLLMSLFEGVPPSDFLQPPCAALSRGRPQSRPDADAWILDLANNQPLPSLTLL